MMKGRNKAIVCALFAALLTAAYLLACATTPAAPTKTWVTVDPQFDNSGIKKIGVVKLSNSSSRPNLENNIMPDIINFLVTNSGYQVVPINARIDGMPDGSLATAMGKQAGVDAVLFGSVDFYNYENTPWQELQTETGLFGNPIRSYYVTRMKRSVSLTVTYQLYDAKSGALLWTKSPTGSSSTTGSVESATLKDEGVLFKEAMVKITDVLWDLFTHSEKR
jgi:hypothetical protein